MEDRYVSDLPLRYRSFSISFDLELNPRYWLLIPEWGKALSPNYIYCVEFLFLGICFKVAQM